MTHQPVFIERHAWNGEGGVRKMFVPRKKMIDTEKRTIEFIVSTAAKDRDGDIVDPMGWKLEQYKSNPVVLWAHNAAQPPIGKAVAVGVDGGELRAVAQFASREEYEFADTVFRLYQGGYLNAVSAGFMPTESKMEQDEETGSVWFRFLSQDLWEFSAVPVPSNPEALVAARAAKINVDPAVEWIESHLDDPAFRAQSAERDLLSGAYIALKGRVHSGIQSDLADKNAKRKAIEAEVATIEAAEDKGAKGDEFTTTGGEGHEHQFALGDSMTSEDGDPPHVHGVEYDDEGKATIGNAEGHMHEAPSGAFVAVEEDGEVAEDEEDEMKTAEITNFPEEGENLPVRLANSAYPRFPAAEAAALSKAWPEVWAKAEGDLMLGEDEGDIRAREAAAADLIYGEGPEAVVACVKRRLIHAKGIGYMREALAEMKDRTQTRREKAVGVDPETIRKAMKLAASEVAAKSIPVAIEQAVRALRGRLD